MKTIVGLYEDMSTANQVVQGLVNDGISRNQISLVASRRADAYRADAIDTAGRTDLASEPVADTGSAASGGAVTGAVIGGVGGALLSLGALAIPGIGPVIAAGPLVAGLIGAGAGAAVGGLLGALTEVGVPEEEAGYYVEGVNRGGTLVSVQADDDETEHLVELMNRYHPIDVKERSASWRGEAQPDYGDSVAHATGVASDLDNTYATTGTLAGQATNREYEKDHSHSTDSSLAQNNNHGTTQTSIFRDEEHTTQRYGRGDTANVDRSAVNRTTDRPGWSAFNGGDYDAANYRNHYQTTYSNTGHTYEDYDPAYRYGYTLANDTRYTGRDWDAIEADARREWNQNYKGSAWENFKDAVRYGWERTKEAVTH